MIRSAVQQPDALLGWMGSLADPTRLRLLRLLERHELGVVELCEILQLPQSTVSRHLKVLGDQSWVNSRRQGTTHLYRMILDELEPASRRLWLLAREQTDNWATVAQDELRLTRLLNSRQQSEDFFANKAEQWDKLRSELYGDSFTLDALLCLLPRNYVIADLGCGTGVVSAHLAPHVDRVIAVDSSSAMLKAARRRVDDAPNVDLRRGDLSNIPIDSDSCDAALLLLVLTYVEDPAAILRESARILKPGGKLILVDLLPHDRDDFRRQMEQIRMGFSADEILDSLNNAGVSSASIKPLAPEPTAKGPALFLASGSKTASSL